MTEPITVWLCQCGCGQKTSICIVNNARRGFVKGTPKAYVQGHNAVKHGRSYKAVSTRGDRRKVELHRLIAEQAIGRRLDRRNDVHHADGNYQNNVNSNLVICEDRAYHQLLHMRMRVRAAGGNPNTDLFCHACKATKHSSEFYGRKQKLNGKQSRCKTCVREDARRRYRRKAKTAA